MAKLISRKWRIKIMQALSFVPDIYMVRFQYWLKTRHCLNLSNPRRFTEKLQLYKLFYRDEAMRLCVDKYDVRAYIQSLGLEEILIPCYGVYASPDEINFETLPQSFVLKDTLGGGGNSVIIVRDKTKIDFKQLMLQMQQWVNEPIDKKSPGREWVYDGRPHRIIAEQLIEASDANGGLIDYKFFCNYGEIKFLYVISDRVLGKGAMFGIYNEDFSRLPAQRRDEYPLTREIKVPKNYDKMKAIAERIGRQFPEARVDLYNVEGKIYFGEITFFDGSGYMSFEPDEYDTILGDLFEFNTKENGWALPK